MEGKLRQGLTNFLITLIALFLSFFIGGIIIYFMGVNPVKAYGVLIKGAFGSLTALSISLTKAVPLIFTGLAVAVGLKSRVFNIGAEGQFLVGGFLAAWVGFTFELPQPFHIIACLAAAIIGGMLWAMIASSLKYFRNVHVVISTIMLNYIAMLLIQYLIRGPFLAANSTNNKTEMIASTAKLPLLFPRPMTLNLGFIIAIFCIIAIWFLFKKTTTGYELQAVGLNPSASNVGGINVAKNMFMALVISGALAGLAGGIEITGSLYRGIEGFSSNYGFNGIPVALMAHGNPFMIFFSALLLGAMRNGSLLMQMELGISKDMVELIQGLVILFIAGETVIRYFVNKRRREVK